MVCTLPFFPWPSWLAQGKRLALTPWSLGSLYVRLDECSRNGTWSIGRYDVVSYVDANFLRLFLFEQFQGLAPEPRVFKAPQPQIMDRVERVNPPSSPSLPPGRGGGTGNRRMRRGPLCGWSMRRGPTNFDLIASLLEESCLSPYTRLRVGPSRDL